MSLLRTFNWGLNRLTTSAKTPPQNRQSDREMCQQHHNCTHDTVRTPLKITFSPKFNKVGSNTL